MELSATEAFKTALNIELKGERFFKAMAEKTEDYKAKGLFAALAEEEKRHVADIQSILDDMAAVKQESERYTDSQDVDEYINAIMKTNIFEAIDQGADAHNIKNEKEAVKLAIDIEKNAILYYGGLLDIFNSEKIQTVLSKLLNEERDHLKQLVKKLESL